MRQLLNMGMDLSPLATIGCGQPHISQRSADQFATLDWFQRDRLLHKPLEQQAPRSGCPATEPKRECVTALSAAIKRGGHGPNLGVGAAEPDSPGSSARCETSPAVPALCVDNQHRTRLQSLHVAPMKSRHTPIMKNESFWHSKHKHPTGIKKTLAGLGLNLPFSRDEN
jgi:hypothetical protein